MANLGMWTGINQGVQNLTATGMKLMEMRNQQRHQQALEANQAMQLQQNAQQRQDAAEMQKQQLIETQRQRATAEQAQALAQQRFLAENPDQQPWDMARFMKLDSASRLQGIPVDDLPFWNDLKVMAADDKMLRGDVANSVEKKWPEWRAQSRESLYTKASQLSDKAAALPENDPKRKEIMGQIDKVMKAMQLLEGIPDDKAKQAFFPDIWQKEQKDVKPVTTDQLKAAIAMNPALAKSLTPEQQRVLGISEKIPTPPSDIQEYEYAKKNNGFKGTLQDWILSQKKAGATNITTNVSTATQTQLQKDIIEQQTSFDTLKEIEKLTKDDYLTYAGRGKQYVAKVGEKLGTTIVDEEWLAARQQWYQVSKGAAIAYRKWATGVAGSAKELEEIAKSYPDPDKNSPTEFKANLRQAQINTIRLKKRYNMFLLNGITPTKAQLASISLDSIKVDDGEVDGGISQMSRDFLNKKGF